jgi:DNA topoisomerase-1
MTQKSGGKHLVIVESPAKARTIGKYLGDRYQVAASVGHVRDLPTKELGVDVDNGFEPHYVTIRGKGPVLSDLKKKAKGASMVILATDPDREGEAIAYHVAEQLGYAEHNGERFRRVQFREITKRAVQEALERPGPIDMKKVEAQQARRILDRLVGYQVSPLLWKPIRPGLSAGRVQTVALRLICEREVEIRAFVTEEYWSITAHLSKADHAFDAKLHQIDGKAFTLGDEAAAQAVVDAVRGVPFVVTHVKRRERRKNPSPPFTTSTLQQEAAKRLGFSARRTMSVAQRLYEGLEVGARGTFGLITYMRTDSTRVSPTAVEEARTWISGELGTDFLASAPRLWAGKQQKGAQEAHEAIRPSDATLHPSEAARYLESDAARLYELIWLRFVAGQMAPAVYDTTTVDFDLAGGGRRYLFRATGSVVKFEGFTRLYVEAKEAGDHRRLDDLEPLPALDEGDASELRGLEPRQHFTQPPPRFSEASLVRELEKLGIGRPSTYAQILSTIIDRGYVELDQKRFTPTDLGEVVVKLLVRIFPRIFDVEFTSRMENELDRVEEGEVNWRALLAGFYPGFRERVEAGEANSDEIIREILRAEGESCEKCGRPMLVRWNKYGRFLGCSGYPECQNTRSLDGPSPEGEALGDHPEGGRAVLLKSGPYGPYVELTPESGDEKPKRVSLPEGKTPADVNLAYAVQLLSLPRTIGTDDAGEEVVAGIGRYGPFVRRGKTFASLNNDQELWEISLEDAVERIKAKESGKRVALKELGPHPESGDELVVVAGRFGAYVTNGSVNATLPKGMEPEELEMDEAVELLAKAAARKGKGGERKRGAKKGSRGAGGARKGTKKS